MKQKIIDILADLRPEFDFTEDVNFIEEGMLDSFDVVSLVEELEKEFSVKIEGVDVVSSNFATLDSIIALVEKSCAK